MFNKKHILVILIFLGIISVAVTDQLVVKNVQRQVLLNGLYPIQQTFVQFRSQSNLNVFRHVVPSQLQSRIRTIVFSKSKDGKQPFPYTRQQYIYNGQKYVLFKIQLDKSYFSDQEGHIYITTQFLNRYINFPKQITLNQDQKFQIFDNKFFLSVYPVQSQSTAYRFDRLIQYPKGGQLKGNNVIVYNKKQTTEPFTSQTITLHGVNNDPQVYFTDVERIVQISHWGNIGITQFYKLENFGPALKGQFSRVTFGSQQHINVKNAFKGVEANLPYEAWGLYYRDQVGNISTSRAFRDQYKNQVRALFTPRYALLGQWKCNWEIGYNLPTNNHLYHQGNKFQLDNIELEYTLDQIASQKYNLKFVLPEGATNVRIKFGDKVVTPTKIEKSVGYLDFFGRPTYVVQNYRDSLKKKKITVDYQLDALSTLYKPIVLAVIIFSALAVLIVSKRLKLEALKEQKDL